MKQDFKVGAQLEKPLMIFDGDCGFCRFWIHKLTVKGVDYEAFQSTSIQKRFPEIPQESFRRSIQFIEKDGNVYEGAEAFFRSLATNPKKRWPLWFYQKIPGVAAVTEWGYRRIANNRSFLSFLSGTRKKEV